MGLITRTGASASLFQDDDGKVYWLVDGGWIAPLNEKMNALAADLQLLRPHDPNEPPGEQPTQVGRWGAAMFKKDGRYYLSCADIGGRLGVPVYDTWVASSDSIYGPYGPRCLAVPHGGEANIFLSHAGQWYSTFNGRDSRAVLTDRPAIVPLRWTQEVMYKYRMPEFPIKDPNVITEAWGWEKSLPLTDHKFRDLGFIDGKDGYYYFSGLHADQRLHFRIVLFRSKKLDTPEPWELVPVMEWKDIPWFDESPEKTAERKGLERSTFRCKPYYAADTFWMTYTIWSKRKDFVTGEGVLKSLSGKLTGPWENVRHEKVVGAPFQDTDGQIYLYRTCSLKPVDKDLNDMTDIAVRDSTGKLLQQDHNGYYLLETTDGSSFLRVDIGGYLFMIDGKYVIAETGWHGSYSHGRDKAWGTYDLMLYWADQIGGPYKPARIVLPHGGHGGLLQDREGKWWFGSFANDNFIPDTGLPRLMPIELKWDGSNFSVAPRQEGFASQH